MYGRGLICIFLEEILINVISGPCESNLKTTPWKTLSIGSARPGNIPSPRVFLRRSTSFSVNRYFGNRRKSFKEKRNSCVGCYSKKFYVAKFKIYSIYIHWNKIYLHIITFIYILHLKSNLINWRLNHNFIVKPVDVTESFISSGQVSRFSFCCISQGCGPKK